MTDEERARAYWAADEWPDPSPVQREQLIVHLTAEFEAVRLDERRACVAFLEREALTLRAHTFGRWDADLVGGLARRIGRGEHAGGGT